MQSTDRIWDPAAYKRGYQGVEAAETFPTATALADYRRMLLDDTEREVGFIARHVGRRKLRVMDLGSGNGRLLVRLALDGMLEFGLGVEISRSRVAFAERWVRDLGLGCIRTVGADVLEFDGFRQASFDLVTCLSDAFSYFRPIREDAPGAVLARMHAALAPQGCVLLQTYQLSEKRRQLLALSGGRLRVWRPLPSADRFAYYLSDIEYLAERRILIHRKTFIARDGAIDAGRVEVVEHSSRAELLELLRAGGFDQPQIFGDFEDAAHQDGESEMLVTLSGLTGWRDQGDAGHSAFAARHSGKDGPGAWVLEDRA